MRRRDYRCTACGDVFEFVDSMNDPIHEFLPCQKCGQPAKRQMVVPTIGKINRGVFVTDFPAGIVNGKMTYHTIPRDEVERRLAIKPAEPFADDPGFEARMADRVERLMARQDAGELPPPPEVTTEQREMVEKALKAETPA